MGLFDDMLSDSQTLFKDESVLDFDYVPPSVTNRDDEIRTMVESIKPLFAQRRASHLFITGSPGIGKTLTAKFVLSELKKSSSDIIPCYVNNWKFSSYHSVFVELSKFFGVPFPRKGVSTDEIIRQIINSSRSKKGVVIVFDEVDKANNLDFLYPLMEGIGKKVCFMLISNYKSFFEKVDPRLLSRLNMESLEFKNYTYNQVKEIIKERIDYAFFPDVFNDDAFDRIVDYTYDKKDLRLGISLLLKSGRIAEKNASKKIKLEHVDEAISLIKDSVFEDRASGLDNKERLLLELIRKMEGSITGDIYDKYTEIYFKITLRTFRSYLNKLESMGFIRTESTGAGFRGKSRRIFLR